MDKLLERKLKARVDADEKMLAAKQAAEREFRIVTKTLTFPVRSRDKEKG